MIACLRIGLVLVAAALAVGVPLSGSALAQRVESPASHTVPAAPPAQQRTIRFSGYDWTVKSYTDVRFDPGPNYWSDTADNVFVDAQGRLHLKITFRDGKWWSAEVVNTRSLGYGKYSVTIESPAIFNTDGMVVGAFTYSDDIGPVGDHREIDLEFSRVFNPSVNAQYVVQPFQTPGNILRWVMPTEPVSTHSFTWLPFAVSFESTTPTGLVNSWRNTGPTIPIPGGERFHLNNWLWMGDPPPNGQEIEVIFSSFTFQPGANAFFSLPIALFRGGF